MRRRAHLIVGIALAFLLVPGLAWAAPRTESGYGLPHDASVQGWRTDWLINVTTVFVAIMFLATVIWLVVAGLFHGRKHRAHYDHGNARTQTVKALCLSALVFGVVDGNLFLSGMADLDDAFWNFDGAKSHPGGVRVQVNAHQWAWDMRQPGSDGKFNTPDDIVSLNELRVPVGVPVVLQLAATDVIHSFSLAHFRTKQDAVPGQITRLLFSAKETGEFEIACAQHCGVHHYKMSGILIVMQPAAYRAWHNEASALAIRGFDGNDKDAQWGWDWDRQAR